MKQQTTLPKGHERLEKVMAHIGLASRREAKDLITSGKVSVNGTVVTESGFGIVPSKDEISIAGAKTKESYLVYKARGIETTKTTPGQKDLHDQFKQLRHLAPVGRLDKDSEGLIILSNDGTLTKALTGIDSHIGKTYLVSVRENVTDASLQKMARGIELDTIMTKPAVTKRVSRTSFTITLYEGRKHQIRRMCDVCHLTIISLIRTGIGHLKSDGMKSGNVKRLTPTDSELLKK